MKLTLRTFLMILILSSCGKPAQKVEQEDQEESTDPNRALYDQVMNVHDEVMPKMEDIYKFKKELTGKIAKSPDQKADLEKVIANLDSADQAMMDWMHNFEPLADSVDQEKAREYLETEMEKIKKVKELTDESLEKAEAALKK
jgi:hypothetical protein